MKTLLMILAFVSLLTGCAWFKGSGPVGDTGSNAMGTGRGTTGVSTGADAEDQGEVTGSDMPP
jgi:hypothetical protein